MPKQLTVCAGCGRLYGVRCERCNPKTNRENHSDARWRRLSKEKRSRDPLCEICDRQGFVRAADEVHHIKPVSEFPHLKYEWSNLVSICRDCHQKEHRQD